MKMKVIGFIAPGWRAYSVDEDGSNLPEIYGPWTRVRAVDAPAEALADLRDKGYWLTKAKNP